MILYQYQYHYHNRLRQKQKILCDLYYHKNEDIFLLTYLRQQQFCSPSIICNFATVHCGFYQAFIIDSKYNLYFIFLNSNFKVSTDMSINFQSNFISDCHCFASDYKKRSFSQGMTISNPYEQKVLAKISREGTESSCDNKLCLPKGSQKIQKKSLKKQQHKLIHRDNNEKVLQNTKAYSDRSYIVKDSFGGIKDKPIPTLQQLQLNIKPTNANHNLMDHNNYNYHEQAKLLEKTNSGFNLIRSTHDPAFLNQVHDIIPINLQNQHLSMAYQNPEKKYQQQASYTFRQIMGSQTNRPLLKKCYQKQYPIKSNEKKQCYFSYNTPEYPQNSYGLKTQGQSYTDSYEINIQGPSPFKLAENDPSQLNSPIKSISTPNSIFAKKSDYSQKYINNQLSPFQQVSLEESYRKPQSTRHKLKKKISITKDSDALFSQIHHKVGNKILHPKQIQSVFDSEQDKSSTFSQVIYNQNLRFDNYHPKVGFQLQSLIQRTQPNNVFGQMKGTTTTQSQIKY